MGTLRRDLPLKRPLEPMSALVTYADLPIMLHFVREGWATVRLLWSLLLPADHQRVPRGRTEKAGNFGGTEVRIETLCKRRRPMSIYLQYMAATGSLSLLIRARTTTDARQERLGATPFSWSMPRIL